MNKTYPDQFLGRPPCSVEEADVIILPLPLEKTVSYGAGTSRAPGAIIDASCQIELFDEQTAVDFEQGPKIHTAPPVPYGSSVRKYLASIQERVARHPGKFVLALGGEHTVSYGVVRGLVEYLTRLTIVQIDAHADLAEELDGQRWSHGTVMKRLWDEGCRIVQIGVRSLSRGEYDLAAADGRIETHFAHRLPEQWDGVLERLGQLTGEVYLSIDVDGLDPSVIPSTGTPQPDGLSWRQTIDVLQAVMSARCQVVGADICEFVPSTPAPGCDIIPAKLAAKVLAFWWRAASERARTSGR